MCCPVLESMNPSTLAALSRISHKLHIVLTHTSNHMEKTKTVMRLLLSCLLLSLITAGCASRPPLHRACLQGNFEEVKSLVESGQNIEQCFSTWTPLNFAAGANELEIAKYLLEKGAKPNGARDDATPVHSAAFWGNKTMIALLADHGADVNKTTGYTLGTALNIVAAGQFRGDPRKPEKAEMDFPGCAALLIQLGADINSRSMLGTPLDLAQSHHWNDVAEVLRKHGATLRPSKKPDRPPSP